MGGDQTLGCRKEEGSRLTPRCFESLYDQGFLRVAACTPRCSIANPSQNIDHVLTLVRDGHSKASHSWCSPSSACLAMRLMTCCSARRFSTASKMPLQSSLAPARHALRW